MRYFSLFAFTALFFTCLSAQQFQWAEWIDRPHANEVGALTLDQAGNVYMAGVYGADSFLPYDGSVYLIKTNGKGEQLWSHSLGDDLMMGEMDIVGEHIFIAVQVQGDITLDGELIFFSSLDFYMGLIILDLDGNFVSAQAYPQYHGQNVHMDVDNDILALQCRGASNLGDNVLFLNEEGTVLSNHSLNIDADILDIAYYDGRTYLVGFASFGESVSIDGVSVPASTFEGQNFIFAFNSDFIAQWAHADTDINGRDNRVVAGPSGIFSYQTVTTNPEFQFTSRMWKFNINGELLAEVEPPTFTNNISLYPDMAMSECHVLLFTKNAFNNNNHELILFDHDLNVVDEKEVIGTSAAYSGQVATHNNQIYIAHVHTDNLDFNGETEITDLLTDAILYPYLAKVGVGNDCGDLEVSDCAIEDFEMFEIFCDTDSTYSFMFNATFIEPGNDSFDLWVNNEFIGFFPINSLPLTLDGITPRNATHDIIKICVNDNTDCCYILEYLRPECLTTGISEWEQSLEVYPNPVNELLNIRSTQDMSRYTLQVYDLTGREVFRYSGNTISRLDLSALETGLYQLLIIDGEGNRMLKGLVKE